MTYAYARCSTKEQNEARQVDALVAAGIDKSAIVVDHESGKDFERKGYKSLRRKLKKGDLLVVQSLDRFGRNREAITDEWCYLTKTKGVNIKVLDMPLLDTTVGGDALGKFISDLVLQLLSFVAESERTHIKERQRQGIAAAKSRGVRFGRERMQKPEGCEKYMSMLANDRISLRDVASILKVSHTTVHKWLREWKAEQTNKEEV